jgi:hypothetical protein
VFADVAKQVLEVGGGVFPAERLRGRVVAVHEGEQGAAELAEAGKSFGEMTFFWITEKKISSGNPGALPI